MAEHWEKYSYSVDMESETTATKVLRLVGENKRVLELGSAVGSMTRLMKEINGCTVVAMELDPGMAQMAEPYCERMVVGNVESMDLDMAFGEDRFDVIVAADILEHLYDPWACLRKVRKFLKPEGYLVLSVPNVAHNALLAQLLSGRFPYQEKGLLDRTHLRFFTRLDLEEMLLSTGYIPGTWERNTVQEKDTEFAMAWLNAPDWIKQSLHANPEGTTYQFIVRACAGDEMGRLQILNNEAQQMKLEIQRLVVDLDATRANLAEHQKAFSEAKQLITERDTALEAVHKELQESQNALHESRLLLENQVPAQQPPPLRRLLNKITALWKHQ